MLWKPLSSFLPPSIFCSLPFSIKSSDSVQCATLAVASRWQHSLNTDLTCCFFFLLGCADSVSWDDRTGKTSKHTHCVCLCVAAVLQCSSSLALCLLVFVLEETFGEIRKNKAVERGFRPLIPVSLQTQGHITLNTRNLLVQEINSSWINIGPYLVRAELYICRELFGVKVKKPKPQSDIIISDVTLQEW